MPSVLCLLMVLISCEKNENVQSTNEKNEAGTVYSKKHSVASSNKKKGFKWTKNDEQYKNSLVSFATKMNASKVPPPPVEPGEPYPLPNQPEYPEFVEFGYYDDPDDLIIEGPYVAASSAAEETAYQGNAEVLTQIEISKNYLISEGYSDIVAQLDNETDKPKIIFAANTLLDLKIQMERSELITVQKAANCALQAIGYTAIAELGANWAVASRQVILKAVGKVAQRYVGWVGAAIMVASFADCMWG